VTELPDDGHGDAQPRPESLRFGGAARGAAPAQQEEKTPLDRPSFHVAPRGGGWLNDPNGPLFYRGRWHMFYQYLPASAVWDFGLMWGHAVSDDMVHWKSLPPALVPTPGGLDQDGVFSGCAVIDEETDVPVILYTGVRLRASPTAGELPSEEYDCKQPFIESQLAAWPADPDDPDLTHWVKAGEPMLALPPHGMRLAAWRDPYVISTPSTSADGMYTMMVGSGVREKGGTALMYKSKHLTSGWAFHGKLADGCGGTGIAWECPVLAELPDSDAPRSAAAMPAWAPPAWLPRAQAQAHADHGTRGGAAAGMQSAPRPLVWSALQPPPATGTGGDPRRVLFCVSPDAPGNPTLYYIGAFDHKTTRFDMESASGPFQLDLGDVLYAPNACVDPSGRTLLVAWQQERRASPRDHDFAGCLSAPRVLTVEQPADGSGDAPRLVQRPLPELNMLRRAGAAWGIGSLSQGSNGAAVDRASAVRVVEGSSFPIPSVAGPFLDIEVALAPAASTEADCDGLRSGLLVHSWQQDDGGSAALLYDWSRAELSVVFDVVDPVTHTLRFGGDGVRTVGGKLQRPPRRGEPLKLRVLLDATLLEVFTEHGEVLSTRVNRGRQPGYQPGSVTRPSAGVDIISVGGVTDVLGVAAYEMAPIWKECGTDTAMAERVARAEPIGVDPMSLEELFDSSMTHVAEQA